jgi:hypothetical protein
LRIAGNVEEQRDLDFKKEKWILEKECFLFGLLLAWVEVDRVRVIGHVLEGNTCLHIEFLAGVMEDIKRL